MTQKVSRRRYALSGFALIAIGMGIANHQKPYALWIGLAVGVVALLGIYVSTRQSAATKQ